jgi:hypothetical protein
MKFIRKIVAFDDIYTSVVKTFSFEVIFELKKINILSRSRYRKLRSGPYINFLSPKMTSNEKKLNYIVVDIVESYNFCINFICIRVLR